MVQLGLKRMLLKEKESYKLIEKSLKESDVSGDGRKQLSKALCTARGLIIPLVQKGC
jgi:hypothetical protein